MRRLIVFALGGAILALAAVAMSEPPKGMALLKLPSKRTDLVAELTFVGGGKATVTAKGAVIKPGTYDTKSLVLSMQDDKKVVWTLASTDSTGMLERFMIDEDQEKVIDVGPPILFRLQAYQPDAGGVVNIRVDIVGNSREKYFPGAAPRGQRAQNLAFQVVDEDGKTVLASGRMTFTDNTAHYDWTPPKGYARKFTVKIAPEMGPFEWKYYDSYTGHAERKP